MSTLVLRLRTRDGMLRSQVAPDLTADQFWNQVAEMIKKPRNEFAILDAQRNVMPWTGTIGSLGLRHGDILMVDYQPAPPAPPVETATPAAGASALKVVEEPVDKELEARDGLIKRSRDPRFCRHGDKGMCEYCSPLEPYDASYMDEHKIKHLSFHAYLRKLIGVNKKGAGASTNPFLHPLDAPNYKVKVPCLGGHASWPEGICSKCQPSAISLQRQPFRMVDHVEFASADMIESLLGFWRQSGCQRFAFLYGRYEVYDAVPLGIKAVVEALYEPMQSNASDGLKLEYVEGVEGGDETAKQHLAHADAAAAACGLVRVGMIFSDLTDDGSGMGKVQQKRHDKSFFMSSLETVLASHMQRHHPTASKYSATGVFGSRFVTCIISGNADGGIEVDAFQVSESGVAMVDAGIVEPSLSPAQMLVKPSTGTLYVPDVMYQDKNEYGATVQHRADPAFPVEYLLVNVTHGFPSTAAPMFAAGAYPIENRPAMRAQSDRDLAAYVHGSARPDPDFHFLVHLHATGVLDATQFRELAQGLVQRSVGLDEIPAWMTLRAILPAPGGAGGSLASPTAASAPWGDFGGVEQPAHPAAGASTRAWSCRHCTFSNPPSATDCEMCGLPK
ncbi:hypothetical protein AMAG_03322 [Allomyces macrogynus ATCC 38327]|uniref:Nuclear protein localization protein 4 n=1 Tax=Allomyces macrogynus (strain ATCC 38327) TaxID=578462 RepID=A0A0L0S999_ALLM3|nr:hypothetical protein AMAG_03322 [Allomyces macrogynus ATCC 38327]|eukprot:KNE58965.1 hypothetical protein AMAG_03322 [Allomyces macrogynus ATCC 38327]